MALRNRARAAELLGISESSLSNYETGKTKCIPAEMVDQMAVLYNAPELRNIYCMNDCPIGSHKNLAYNEPTIEKVAVHLFNCTETNVLSEKIKDFVRIAQDGFVDESEKENLKTIADIFDSLTFAISEFNILAERQGIISWN